MSNTAIELGGGCDWFAAHTTDVSGALIKVIEQLRKDYFPRYPVAFAELVVTVLELPRFVYSRGVYVTQDGELRVANGKFGSYAPGMHHWIGSGVAFGVKLPVDVEGDPNE